MLKATGIDPKIHEYLLAHRSPDDAILEELRLETEHTTGPYAQMQISPEQGTFLGLLIAAIGARRVLEIGTFTGYSALCMARALPADGTLITCDRSEEWTGMARRYWQRAGVRDRIDLRLGAAADTLRTLPHEPAFDLAFIDADKKGYPLYFEECLARLRPNGIVVFDNAFLLGAVVDPANQSEDTLAIRRTNALVAADPRVEAVTIAVADGLLLARKRA